VRKRLLLIDFEKRSLLATRALLEQAGYTVIPAATGTEAVAAMREQRPDVVVLEPMIPGQDGFLLCQAMKRGDHGGKPVVIVASRIYRGPRYRSMSREMGADYYLERPQQDELLVAVLRRLVPTEAADSEPGPAPVAPRPRAADPVESPSPVVAGKSSKSPTFSSPPSADVADTRETAGATGEVC